MGHELKFSPHSGRQFRSAQNESWQMSEQSTAQLASVSAQSGRQSASPHTENAQSEAQSVGQENGSSHSGVQIKSPQTSGVTPSGPTPWQAQSKAQVEANSPQTASQMPSPQKLSSLQAPQSTPQRSRDSPHEGSQSPSPHTPCSQAPQSSTQSGSCSGRQTPSPHVVCKQAPSTQDPAPHETQLTPSFPQASRSSPSRQRPSSSQHPWQSSDAQAVLPPVPAAIPLSRSEVRPQPSSIRTRARSTKRPGARRPGCSAGEPELLAFALEEERRR